MPTISARRNVADFGQPSARPVQASTSSNVMPSSPIRRIAFSIEYVPMRLAMKLGVSLATTTPLPRVWSQNRVSDSITSGRVAGPGMISTSFR